MIKVLMTYNNTEGMDVLLNNKNFKIDIHSKPSPEKFAELIPEYDCLLIRSEVKVTPDIFKAAKNLKLVGRAGTGVDNVDLKAATEKGVIVMNVPGGNTISACEQTLALLLSMARNIPQAYSSLKKGEWKREKFIGTELAGKTLGLIGLGRIGKEVAKRALSFDMRVIVSDPFVSEDFIKSVGGNIELKQLDDVYKESDFISIHTPKNEATKNMINKNTIAKMKDGVRIINCARGGIINEQDLCDALKSGKVKTAALDVFEKEPPTDTKLLELDNVIATPHLGASTEEAQIKIAEELSQMVIDYFERSIIRNAVNIPSVDSETFRLLQPYIDLIEKIGLMQGQVIEGGVKEINVEYSGEVANMNVLLLTSTYLKGFLAPILDIKINFVNASYIAKERGIKIKEIKNPDNGDYVSLISITVITDKMELNVKGTMFSHNNPRVVAINGLDVDILPAGNMIMIENEDKPGVIGQVGTILGENKINIASMQVGRKKVSGGAITIVTVDSKPEEAVMSKLSRINGVSKVKMIVL